MRTAIKEFERGKIDRSIVKLDDHIRESSQDSSIATAYLGLGWNYYLNNEYDLAISNFSIVIDNYGRDTAAPYAGTLLGYSLLKNQQDEKAIETFQRTFAQYQDSVWAEHCLYMLGKLKYETYDFRDAIRKYQQLMQIFPKSEYSAKALYDTGESYFKIRRYPESIQAFSNCLENYPLAFEAPVAALRIAVYNEGRGFYDEAVTYLDRIIENYRDSPHRLPAMNKKATIFLSREKEEEASVIFQTIIAEYSAHKDSDYALYALADIAMQKNDTNTALSWLGKLADELYRQSMYREDAMARCYTHYKAAEDLQNAERPGIIIASDYPGNALAKDILTELITLSYEKESWEKCSFFCEKIFENETLEAEQKRTIAQYYILIAEHKNPNPRKLLIGYDEYLKTQPPPSFEKLSYIRRYVQLLETYGDSVSKINANQMLFDSTRNNAEKSEASFRIAQIMRNQKKYDEAAKFFENALNLGTDNASAIKSLMKTMEGDKTREKEAEKYYLEAAKLNPDSESAVTALIETLRLNLDTGDIEKAEYYVQRILKLYPDNNLAPLALFYLAGYYQRKGSAAEAKKHYTHIVTQFSGNELAEKARRELQALE